MADLSDVQTALAAQIATVAYPNGTGAASITGAAVRIYPGWPVPAQLDADLPANAAHVSIFDRPDGRDETRYPPVWQTLSIVAPTLTLSVSGLKITVGGVMPSPFTAHNLAVLAGGKAFVYAVQPTDTLTSIATALASLIAATYPGTTSSGPVITMPTGPLPIARVGTTGQAIQEIGRQTQTFQITVWASTDAIRTTLGAAIEAALVGTEFLQMPDGSAARLRRMRPPRNTDALEKVAIYRRDLLYMVEYATTITETVATIVAEAVEIDNEASGAVIAATNF